MRQNPMSIARCASSFRTVAHEDFNQRRSDLRMASFVGLNARDQVREGEVTHIRGVGGQTKHLYVRQSGLECEMKHYRGRDDIRECRRSSMAWRPAIDTQFIEPRLCDAQSNCRSISASWCAKFNRI